MTEEAMKAAQAAIAKKRLDGTLAKKEFNLIKKAKADPKSKVKAIAAFCFHCFGGTEGELPDPGYMESIRTCTAPTCPLYIHRPFRQKP